MDFLKDFFEQLYKHKDNLSQYVDSLYAGTQYTNNELNEILGKLKEEGLIDCSFASNKAYTVSLTFDGKHYYDDQPRIVQLIDEMDDVEHNFHQAGDGSYFSYEEIHDVQKFQDWLQEVKLELQGIYDRTHDQFIWETIRTCEKPMNGTSDRKVFRELSAKLKAIRKNISKYYPENVDSQIDEKTENVPLNNVKNPLIFISHSSKNKEQVEMLVKLLRELNLQQQNIFCSSVPGYGIPVGMNIFDFLRSRFLNYNLHIIFVHSKEYYESPICLNEMGAAWALKSNATSILLPGFDYSEMKGVVDSRDIAIKLDSDRTDVQDRLNQMRRAIESEFGFNPIEDITWERARDKFIDEINASMP